MDMMCRCLFAALFALAFALPAQAQSQNFSDDERYTIMRPEPWLAPKYKSPRGTREHVVIPQPSSIPPARPATPPPLFVPQTGQLLPNLPSGVGSGRGGAETYQDRAARCAHQAGVYGQAAGDRNAYVGGCINQ